MLACGLADAQPIHFALRVCYLSRRSASVPIRIPENAVNPSVGAPGAASMRRTVSGMRSERTPLGDESGAIAVNVRVGRVSLFAIAVSRSVRGLGAQVCDCRASRGTDAAREPPRKGSRRPCKHTPEPRTRTARTTEARSARGHSAPAARPIGVILSSVSSAKNRRTIIACCSLPLRTYAWYSMSLTSSSSTPDS